MSATVDGRGRSATFARTSAKLPIAMVTATVKTACANASLATRENTVNPSIVWTPNVQDMAIAWLVFAFAPRDGKAAIVPSLIWIDPPLPVVNGVNPTVLVMDRTMLNLLNAFVMNDGLGAIVLKVTDGEFAFCFSANVLAFSPDRTMRPRLWNQWPL